MTLAAYQYTSDAGTVYQVVVPADFAAALGMSVASGSEPYLDTQIGPRFANYYSSTGNRTAVIGTSALFRSLSLLLVVGGITYTRTTLQGESTPAYQPANLIVSAQIQGPQGAQGVPGTGLPLATLEQVLGADFTLTSTVTNYIILTQALTAGTWLVISQQEISTVAEVAFFLNLSTAGNVSSNTTVNGLSATYTSSCFYAVFTLSGSQTLTLNATTFNAGAIVRKLNINGEALATKLVCIKIG